MSLYDFDTDLIGSQLLPPVLRKPKQLAWLKVLLTPLQYLRDLFFDKYCGGAAYGYYNIGTTYAKYDRIIYIDNAVYESKIAGNLGMLPISVAGSLTNWRKVQDDYRGVDERVNYNGQYIVFLAAINKHFRITGPDYIYINNTGGNILILYIPIAVYNAYVPFGGNPAVFANFVKKYSFVGAYQGHVTY